MVVSICYERITSFPPAASQQSKIIDQPSQRQQCLHRDATALLDHQCRATTLFEHPTGRNDSQIRLPLNDHHRVHTRPQPANDSNLLSEKRMEPIGESHQSELVSSVLMRCAILLRPTLPKLARPSSPSSR